MNQEHIRQIKTALLRGYGIKAEPEIEEIKTPAGNVTGLYKVTVVQQDFRGIWDSQRQTFVD